MAGPMLHVQDLWASHHVRVGPRHDRGAVPVVRNVQVDVERGSFFTLLGPSGCGKTTLLRCVAGLHRPDRGSIAVAGDVVFSVDPPVDVPPDRRRTGMVFQTHAVGYRRPADVPDGTTLVVGGGNTGFQIAKELSATRKVVLSVGSRQKPLPQRILGRDLFWWLTKMRILDKTVESRLVMNMAPR